MTINEKLFKQEVNKLIAEQHNSTAASDQFELGMKDGAVQAYQKVLKLYDVLKVYGKDGKQKSKGKYLY